MKSFFESYDLIGKASEQKPFESDKINRVCRFCQNDENGTTFKSIPHVMPELFGSNKYTWNEECDACNFKFRDWENSAATFMQPYTTLTATATKKRIPRFQSRKEPGEQSTTLKVEDGARHFYFGANLEDFEYLDDNRFRVIMRGKPFNPFHVYKLMLKIGISLLPEDEMDNNPHFLECLNNDEVDASGQQFYTLLRYQLNGKKFSKPDAYLYKAKQTLTENDLIPEYVLIISAANLIFQMMLPLSVVNKEQYTPDKTYHIEIFPFFVYDEIQELASVKVFHMDCSVNEKITVNEEIIGNYDSIEKNVNKGSMRG